MRRQAEERKKRLDDGLSAAEDKRGERRSGKGQRSVMNGTAYTVLCHLNQGNVSYTGKTGGTEQQQTHDEQGQTEID